MYVKKTATIEGDRLKGHYMETELTKELKIKFIFMQQMLMLARVN